MAQKTTSGAAPRVGQGLAGSATTHRCHDRQRNSGEAFSDGGKTTRDVLAPTLHGPVKPQLAPSQVGQGRLQLVPSLLVWPRGCKSSGQHVNVGILNSSTVNLPSTSLSSTLGPPSTTTPRVGPLKKDPEGYPRLPQRPSLPQAIRAPSAR
ncbi:hypothetical protein Pmani_019706 [Petrolisthes manimaculis]|uniref:Uncharacterized protein n=1 Tax=Petrolisthes manimaculis TaxID=1843537 RepID=A0AAE1U3Q9_9EUCA|nr:hypothetical protein Pmani_019706 [Petrolisthes manimaculis]